MVGGSSTIWVFPLVIADSEREMPGIEPGPLGWYASALTTGLQEVNYSFYSVKLLYNFVVYQSIDIRDQ